MAVMLIAWSYDCWPEPPFDEYWYTRTAFVPNPVHEILVGMSPREVLECIEANQYYWYRKDNGLIKLM